MALKFPIGRELPIGRSAGKAAVDAAKDTGKMREKRRSPVSTKLGHVLPRRRMGLWASAEMGAKRLYFPSCLTDIITVVYGDIVRRRIPIELILGPLDIQGELVKMALSLVLPSRQAPGP